MSGAHAQHRVGNRPLIIGGVPVLKFDKHDQPVWKYYAKPGGTYVNGRCVDYETGRYVATRHVLDYRPEPVRISKHAAGRTRKLDGRNKARLVRMRQRTVQAQKSATIDASKLRMMLPG